MDGEKKIAALGVSTALVLDLTPALALAAGGPGGPHVPGNPLENASQEQADASTAQTGDSEGFPGQQSPQQRATSRAA